MKTASVRHLLAGAIALGAVACSSAYYGTMETFGVHKRDILVDRVTDARDDQEEAKKQFQTTLDAFREVTGWEPGRLGEAYEKLNDEYEDCEARADDVHARIKSIEDVSGALFKEWEEEDKTFTDPKLKAQSQQMLKDTKDRYGELIGAMKKAEASMAPPLAAFHDQVTFLKHNLNAQAIASLETQVGVIETDVKKLVADMEASIAEADSFIKTLNTNAPKS